jgi:hypothetical protein
MHTDMTCPNVGRGEGEFVDCTAHGPTRAWPRTEILLDDEHGVMKEYRIWICMKCWRS